MEEGSSSSDNDSKIIGHSKKSSNVNDNENIQNKNEEEEEELKNYYTYINECLTNTEEKRQNYINYLEELKSKVNDIKSKNLKNNEYAIIVLDECIKFIDDNFSIFSMTKEILSKFNDLNDTAQNYVFSFHKIQYSLAYYEEMYNKIKMEFQEKENENEKLKKTIKDLSDIKNEKLLINNEKENKKKNIEIKNKMDNLIEENIELKRKYSQVITESQLLKKSIDQQNFLKQKSSQEMSNLQSKIDLYENKIDKLQNKINEIKNENEKLNSERKLGEKPNEEENVLNLENVKSCPSDDSSVKVGINLDELLDNDNNIEDNENKTEEENKNKNNIKINVNNNNNINNISNEKKSEKSIGPLKYNEYDMDIEKKSDIFNLCPLAKKEKKKLKLNNLKMFKSPISYISSQSSNLYNDKRKRNNAKSVYSYISKKKEETDKNYYKIFFFLLLKSFIINNNILGSLQKNDFDSLYEECQKEKIPFNQYEEWIKNKMDVNSNNKENNIDVDSTFIDCFICSSMI